MAEVPETGQFTYVDAQVLTVWDDGSDDQVIGTLYGPRGEVLLQIERPFGYARWAHEQK